MLVELTVAKQRYDAVKEVIAQGLTVTEVAVRYKISRQTVHEWLARYRAGGLRALADRSYRPKSCPHQMDAETEARVLDLRQTHPGWGPVRLRYALERERMEQVPGRSTIYRALVRAGLVGQDSSSRTPGSQLSEHPLLKGIVLVDQRWKSRRLRSPTERHDQ